MKSTTLLLSGALAALLALPAPVQAVDPVRNGALATPANRIVGLWTTEGAVRPCGSGLPASTIRNTLLFNAGGTVIENPRSPPGGDRTLAIGTWSFDPVSGVHSLHLRFDWYAAGVYGGYQTVDRQMIISNDGLQITGEVVSTRHAANGAVLVALCGTAISDRI